MSLWQWMNLISKHRCIDICLVWWRLLIEWLHWQCGRTCANIGLVFTTHPISGILPAKNNNPPAPRWEKLLCKMLTNFQVPVPFPAITLSRIITCMYVLCVCYSVCGALPPTTAQITQWAGCCLRLSYARCLRPAGECAGVSLSDLLLWC